MLERDNAISTLFFPINMLENTLFIVPPSFCFWPPGSPVELSPHQISPYSGKKHLCILLLTWIPQGTQLPFPSQRKCLLKQAGLVPLLLGFQHLAVACPCAHRRWCFKSDQHFWTPAPSNTFSLGTLQPEVRSPRGPSWGFAGPFPLVRGVNLAALLVAVARTAANAHLAQGTGGSAGGPAPGGLSWWVLGCGELPPYCQEAPWGGGRVCREPRGLACICLLLIWGKQRARAPQGSRRHDVLVLLVLPPALLAEQHLCPCPPLALGMHTKPSPVSLPETPKWPRGLERTAVISVLHFLVCSRPS